MTTNVLLKGSYSGDMSTRKATKSTSRRTPRKTGGRAQPEPGRYPNRINELAKERGMTQDDLAEKIGVHRVTIADYARGTVPLRQNRLEQLAALFDVPVSEVLEQPLIAGMRSVPIVVPLQAGDWSEHHGFEPDERKTIVVPDDPALQSLSLYAGRIVGESMNKIYPHDSIVVLSRKQDRPGEIIAGKRYHVRRTRGGQLVEETIKTLVKDARGQFWMQPESDMPEFTAFPLDGGPDETVEIIGRVRYAVRRED